MTFHGIFISRYVFLCIMITLKFYITIIIYHDYHGITNTRFWLSFQTNKPTFEPVSFMTMFNFVNKPTQWCKFFYWQFCFSWVIEATESNILFLLYIHNACILINIISLLFCANQSIFYASFLVNK